MPIPVQSECAFCKTMGHPCFDHAKPSQSRAMRRARSRASQSAFEKAKAAQTYFWDSLRELESALGCDVDGTLDLSELSPADLVHG